MTDEAMYKEIRPYRDHEFRKVMDEMLISPTADLLINTVFPDVPVEVVKNTLIWLD